MTDFLDYISAIKEDRSSSDFQNLIQLFEHKVFTMCYRIIGNREEAEEASQDVFLNCYRSLHNLKDESKFPQWLMKIAYLKAIDYVRKKKVNKVGFDEISEMPGDINNTGAETLEQSELLEKSLQLLAPQSRAIINLYYQEDMAIKEIADLLDLSESNVKIQLHRSRIKMKTILESKSNVKPNKLI